MRFPNEETVKRVREQYPAGTRIELVRMDDVQTPPEGTHGTVVGVDDTASLLVNWDNGSGLNVVYGEDIVKKLKTVKTVCYGEEKIWDNREEAAGFFLEGMAMSEGSEQARYTKIYSELMAGMEVCTDGCGD